jgi:putative membrane protein
MGLVQALPHLNGLLNAIAAILLTGGYLFIRRGDVARHRACMISASCVSAVFLVSYLAHRFNVPILQFHGPEGLKPYYFTLLGSHVALSVAIVPLVVLTLWRALHGRYDLHRKVARWTWPAWMYVSISGIVVYLLLYQVYPA